MSISNAESIERCGVVLAAGFSRRYGSPKAFAKKNGEYYYAIASELLASVCDQVLIVSRVEHFDWFQHGEFVITDEPHILGEGPLAGIYSAMKTVHAKDYLILPCDMPNMKREVLTSLIEKANDTTITAITANGKKHPLVSIWPRMILEHIAETLEQKRRKVIDLMESTGVTWIEGSSLVQDSNFVFKNINTPEG